jgi:mono/diheme cytochrome c family protein
MNPRRVVLLLVALFVMIVGMGYGYLTTHGFSAREKPSWVEAFVARRLRALATTREARRLTNPLQGTALELAEGRDHFADHCALCHGNTGDGKTAINEGLYPPAPDLRAEDTQALSDGELFDIIRNGVRFTGMPGWGGGEDENWKLVLFIRHLPRLSPEEVKLMREVNGGEEESHDSHH